MKVKFRRSWLAAILAAVMMGALLAACGKSDSGKTKVTIGEVTRSLFYAPQYVAIANGYFEDEGIDIELTTTPGGDKTMTALLSGTVDVALVGSETSIYVYQQGADDPVINFAQLTQTDGTFLVARKPIDKFDWSTLRGVEFLGQRKGGMPQMAGEFTLKKHGIDPHNDLKLIQNIDFANIPAAFLSGTGEYVQLFEPQASIVEKEGKGYVVASFGVESGRLPYTVFMAKQSYMDKNKDVIQSFANAIHRAQKWVAEHSAEEIADVVLPYFENTDREIAISAIGRYKQQGSYAADPIVDETEWNNLLDVMTSAGELKERAAYDKIVDTTYAEQAIIEVK